jgi:hypothetical protein
VPLAILLGVMIGDASGPIRAGMQATMPSSAGGAPEPIFAIALIRKSAVPHVAMRPTGQVPLFFYIAHLTGREKEGVGSAAFVA